MKNSSCSSSSLLPFLACEDLPYENKSLDDFSDRKSFYYKAEILVGRDGAIYLRSYRTKVAKYKNGKIYRLWGDWSATTGRHLNAFAKMMGRMRGMCKADWDSLKVVAG